MGLWDSHKVTDPKEVDEALSKIRALSPEELKAEREAHLVTHCEHGTLRTAHCPWCHIQTPAYRQTLVDAMWTVLAK